MTMSEYEGRAPPKSQSAEGVETVYDEQVEVEVEQLKDQEVVPQQQQGGAVGSVNDDSLRSLNSNSANSKSLRRAVSKKVQQKRRKIGNMLATKNREKRKSSPRSRSKSATAPRVRAKLLTDEQTMVLNELRDSFQRLHEAIETKNRLLFLTLFAKELEIVDPVGTFEQSDPGLYFDAFLSPNTKIVLDIAADSVLIDPIRRRIYCELVFETQRPNGTKCVQPTHWQLTYDQLSLINTFHTYWNIYSKQRVHNGGVVDTIYGQIDSAYLGWSLYRLYGFDIALQYGKSIYKELFQYESKCVDRFVRAVLSENKALVIKLFTNKEKPVVELPFETVTAGVDELYDKLKTLRLKEIRVVNSFKAASCVSARLIFSYGANYFVPAFAIFYLHKENGNKIYKLTLYWSPPNITGT